MQTKEVVIPYKQADTIDIYALGDIHLGTKHCSEGKVKKIVDLIKSDPLARWVDMGDKGEFITPSDPRWDAAIISDWLDKDNIAHDIENRYCELMSPIVSQCDGLVEGNHEHSLRTHGHNDVHRNICHKLGVDDLGYSAYIHYSFRRKRSTESHLFKGFFTHGAGCAVTEGAKLTRLVRLMASFDADFYAHGHVHDIITHTKPYITTDHNCQVVQRVKVGAMTGCFFRTYSQGIRASYGEIKNYPPTTLGCVKFCINPARQYIKVVKVEV